jgi:hypothetical protein
VKRYIFVIILLFTLSSCTSNLDVAVQDLSRATPTAAVVLDQGASSYVKVKDAEPEEEVYNEDEIEKRVYREGDLIQFDPIGIDPDGDIITYKYSLPLMEDGTWKTTVGDEGTYLITITASDGKVEVEKKVLLLILPVNRAPTLDNLDDITAMEGDHLVLKPRIFDYNNDEIELSFSKPFNQNGEWQTDYESEGTYVVKVTAKDQETTVEEQITVTILNVNRAPIINDIEHVSVLSGETVVLKATAKDLDNDDVTISYENPLNAEGMWTPTEADLGTYAVTVTASDGKDSSEKIVTIIVNHRNMAPVISIEEEIRAEETDRVTLKPTIVDPEGRELIITYSTPFDNTGVWATDYKDAGTYDVTITATDDEELTTEKTITVTIYDRNRAPTFTI